MTTHRSAASTDKRLGEAARWYVRHESDEELTSTEWSEWEDWTADPENCAEYEQFVRMHRQTRSMARPMLPSHEEVRGDVPWRGGFRRLWLSATSTEHSRHGFRRPVSAAAVASVAIAAWVILLSSDRARHEPPAPKMVSQGEGAAFSESTLASLRAAGRPVLVNLRAAWCGTCVANERTLSSEPVRQMMERKHVAYLEGDWTDQSPAISPTIQRFGRGGVPLYLLYCPGSRNPEILPQILTEVIVLNALSRLPDLSGPPT